MQPNQARAIDNEMRRWPSEAGRSVVNSRRHALDQLRAANEGGPPGPVLITGEPGAGKSWLARRFAEGLPAGWRSAVVELTSTLDGLEMLRLVGDGLGLEMPDRLGAARLTLRAALRDAAADGRRWLLILDEAQRATAEAWEEIQVLSHRLGRAEGFAAMILLGGTELARELAAGRRHGWANRIGLHIHLPPLDLDEARQLLGQEVGLTEPQLETLHRDALGNPRAMLRMVEAWARASRPVLAPGATDFESRSLRLPRAVPLAEPRPDECAGEEAAAPPGVGVPAPGHEGPLPRLPSLIPARPPIRLEEGLVEVGWEGDLEAEPTRQQASPSDTVTDPSGGTYPSEELVEDRYAALQAWAEWSRNRERPDPNVSDPATPADVGASRDVSGPDPGAAEPPRGDSAPIPAPSVRAETPHDFAPYGQLFSRLRHSL
jgi:type II secretory pathway predicted ATPase ExeA